ncbi:MAG: hypothetical protein KAT05_11660, partial [Spirochaetes bacterium]|nr:hypothetical protein [Spirochaetota bacterium]
MVIKNLLLNNDNIFDIHNNFIIEKSNNNNSKDYDIFLISNINQLNKISKKYPSSLILFYYNKNLNKLPDNVFCISSPIKKNDSIQLHNITNLVQKIKESFFRKIILSLKNETDIHVIYTSMKEIGFDLKIYKKDEKINFLNKNEYENN